MIDYAHFFDERRSIFANNPTLCSKPICSPINSFARNAHTVRIIGNLDNNKYMDTWFTTEPRRTSLIVLQSDNNCVKCAYARDNHAIWSRILLSLLHNYKWAMWSCISCNERFDSMSAWFYKNHQWGVQRCATGTLRFIVTVPCSTSSRVPECS